MFLILLNFQVYVYEYEYLTVSLFCTALCCFELLCAYDFFFVIYHVLQILCNFVTYCFDLIAYCNQHFHIQSDLCGSVIVCIYVCMYVCVFYIYIVENEPLQQDTLHMSR
jgi:hypothetical protein